MHFDFGYPSTIFSRDWKFYLGIQAIIFVKTIFFFFIYGYGVSYVGQPLAFSFPFVAVPIFGSPIHVVDFFFHQLMHVLIAVWVFLVAKHVRNIRWVELTGLFLVAVVIHNVGYWLTHAHPSVNYSFYDFGVDFIALWVFFLVFRAGIHFFSRLKKWKIPFVE